ncbi:hypothetical protein M1M86_01635 [Dehalococcoidales bacterium]|nr:hypothetical protein [Dehalococcoidales bacterium]
MKYKDKFGFLLDDVLGIRPYQTATRWVKQRALELAAKYPFPQAMSLLRDEEEARQEAVFGRAEKVRNDGKEREIKVIYGGIEGATTLARGSISRVNKPELSQESATYQRWSGLFQSYQLDWWH